MATEPSSATEQARIRTVIDGRAQALRRKDAEGVLRHHAPDFVHFSLAPPLISTATDATGLEAWFATWLGPIGYEMRELTITASDGAAFCHGLVRMSGTKIDGEHDEIWFRVTLGLREIEGAWRIAHEHKSVPFYMDGSYRAAVDLEP